MKKCRFSISANFNRIRPAPSGCISCELTVTFTAVRKSPLGVVYYLNKSSSTTTHRPRTSGDRAGDERPCGDLLPAQALQGPLPALFAFPTGSDADVDVKVHATVAAVYNEPRPMVRGGGEGGGGWSGSAGWWVGFLAMLISHTHTHTHTHQCSIFNDNDDDFSAGESCWTGFTLWLSMRFNIICLPMPHRHLPRLPHFRPSLRRSKQIKKEIQNELSTNPENGAQQQEWN